jgi:predicted enzyme related to lactoylglutathione lyase
VSDAGRTCAGHRKEVAHVASANKGRFVWYEHLAGDVPASISYYSEVVGWKPQPFGEGTGYTMWVGSQGPLGGVMALPPGGAGPHWMAHVQVDDVDATAGSALRLGGKVHHPPTDIPDVGRFAVLADPQGATLSVFQPRTAEELHDPSKDGEFCWNELVTSDGAAALRFYSALLGWKSLEEMDMGPMGTYRVFGLGDTRIGGMMNLPGGAPARPSWLYYVSTSDLEAAVDRATRRGGKLLNGPMDIPGGGRIAQLADPQGAAFALHQAP